MTTEPNDTPPAKQRGGLGNAFDAQSIAQWRVIAWVWLAIFLGGAVLFQITLPRLPGSIWMSFVWALRRTGGTTSFQLESDTVAVLVWVFIALFAAAVFAFQFVERSAEISSSSRTSGWSLLLVVVLSIVGIICFTSIIPGAILQVGAPRDESVARHLIEGPSGAVGIPVFIAWLLSMYVPVHFAQRRSRKAFLASIAQNERDYRNKRARERRALTKKQHEALPTTPPESSESSDVRTPARRPPLT